jgi:hypothetical protein
MKLEIKKRLDRWFTGHKEKNWDPAQEPPAIAGPVSAPAVEIVEAEIVAAIAAVVAIEVKMFMALQGRSFTFNEGSQSQGWNEWGRLLIRPYQGAR